MHELRQQFRGVRGRAAATLRQEAAGLEAAVSIQLGATSPGLSRRAPGPNRRSTASKRRQSETAKGDFWAEICPGGEDE